MSNLNQFEQCFICSEEYKIMISWQQSLSDFDGLALVHVLQRLNFLTISDAAQIDQILCLNCATNVQHCYQLKRKCEQIENPWKNIAQSLHSALNTSKLVEDLSEDPLAIPWSTIKSEIVEDISAISEEKHFRFQEENFHETRFTCPICGKKFKRKAYFNNHFHIHTGEKHNVCDVCDKSFKDAHNLRVHKLIHTDQKRYACDVCNKKFMLLKRLTTHKMLHSGEKPFACDVCDKAFSRSHNLKVHKLRHSGLKPFMCNICNKSYAHSNSLKAHKVIHWCSNFDIQYQNLC